MMYMCYDLYLPHFDEIYIRQIDIKTLIMFYTIVYSLNNLFTTSSATQLARQIFFHNLIL